MRISDQGTRAQAREDRLESHSMLGESAPMFVPALAERLFRPLSIRSLCPGSRLRAVLARRHHSARMPLLRVLERRFGGMLVEGGRLVSTSRWVARAPREGAHSDSVHSDGTYSGGEKPAVSRPLASARYVSSPALTEAGWPFGQAATLPVSSEGHLPGRSSSPVSVLASAPSGTSRPRLLAPEQERATSAGPGAAQRQTPARTPAQTTAQRGGVAAGMDGTVSQAPVIPRARMSEVHLSDIPAFLMSESAPLAARVLPVEEHVPSSSQREVGSLTSSSVLGRARGPSWSPMQVFPARAPAVSRADDAAGMLAQPSPLEQTSSPARAMAHQPMDLPARAPAERTVIQGARMDGASGSVAWPGFEGVSSTPRPSGTGGGKVLASGPGQSSRLAGVHPTLEPAVRSVTGARAIPAGATMPMLEPGATGRGDVLPSLQLHTPASSESTGLLSGPASALSSPPDAERSRVQASVAGKTRSERLHVEGVPVQRLLSTSAQGGIAVEGQAVASQAVASRALEDQARKAPPNLDSGAERLEQASPAGPPVRASDPHAGPSSADSRAFGAVPPFVQGQERLSASGLAGVLSGEESAGSQLRALSSGMAPAVPRLQGGVPAGNVAGRADQMPGHSSSGSLSHSLPVPLEQLTQEVQRRILEHLSRERERGALLL